MQFLCSFYCYCLLFYYSPTSLAKTNARRFPVKRSKFKGQLAMSSPNLSSALMGSAPGERTKMRGAVHTLSLNDPERSKGGGSMYFLPIFSVTKLWMAGTILSGRIHLEAGNIEPEISGKHGNNL